MTKQLRTHPSDTGELLSRGVAQIIVRESVAKKLSSGKKLRIKLGVDPTAPHLHLGHAVILRKMRAFQDLGHTVIFLVGDFTARIGDPTDQSSARKQLTPEDIAQNMASYAAEAGKILDMKKTEIRYNSEWLAHMDFAEIFDLASLFSVQRMLERDMFEERMKQGRPVWLHEFLYPIMQGYDSVALKADIEFGGTDQTFNVLAARTIQPHYSQDPQDIMTFELLEGTDGKRKMSMSIGNTINLVDSPDEMYGKTMAIPDTLILRYFMLATDVPDQEIRQFEQDMKKGANPKLYKERLANELVMMYHGKAEATQAAADFTKIFKDKQNPDTIPEKKVRDSSYQFIDLLVVLQLASSKGEARRLIQQGAVSMDGKVSKDWQATVAVKNGMVVKVGKRKFVKIRKK